MSFLTARWFNGLLLGFSLFATLIVLINSIYYYTIRNTFNGGDSPLISPTVMGWLNAIVLFALIVINIILGIRIYRGQTSVSFASSFQKTFGLDDNFLERAKAKLDKLGPNNEFTATIDDKTVDLTRQRGGLYKGSDDNYYKCSDGRCKGPLEPDSTYVQDRLKDLGKIDKRYKIPNLLAPVNA